MMIEHTIFARSNTILSDQNGCLLSHNIMEEGLGKILLDQDDRANKFCSILDHMCFCSIIWSVIDLINDPVESYHQQGLGLQIFVF